MLHDRLTGAPRGATGDEGAANAHITRAMVAALTSVATQIKTLDAQIAEQLSLHADAHIFTSLPRSGTVRAARLLAEIGDCRARFPTPESLACLAGVAPSTRQSGKVKHVGFRWAADKQLRDAVCDFAGDSRRPLQPRHRPRTRPPPRRAHPGPRLALRHLALLARRRRLPPCQPSRPPGTAQPRSRPGGLTQGYSSA